MRSWDELSVEVLQDLMVYGHWQGEFAGVRYHVSAQPDGTCRWKELPPLTPVQKIREEAERVEQVKNQQLWLDAWEAAGQ